MKKLLLFITVIFICGAAIAQTIRWHIGDTVYQTTTCNAGESITPPTAPEKFGYSFREWVEYIPIEYLESTGTQYIDTGVLANNNLKIDISFSDVRKWIVGAVEIAGQVDDFGIASGAIRFGTRFVAGIQLPTGIVNIKEDKNGYAINNVYKSWDETAVLEGRKNIYLFWAKGSSVAKSGKIYFCKLYDNDVLVRDFIPVLDKNGTPCMYDRVENKFYYNAGTGDFIAGPVLNE